MVIEKIKNLKKAFSDLTEQFPFETFGHIDTETVKQQLTISFREVSDVAEQLAAHTSLPPVAKFFATAKPNITYIFDAIKNGEFGNPVVGDYFKNIDAALEQLNSEMEQLVKESFTLPENSTKITKTLFDIVERDVEYPGKNFTADVCYDICVQEITIVADALKAIIHKDDARVEYINCVIRSIEHILKSNFKNGKPYLTKPSGVMGAISGAIAMLMVTGEAIMRLELHGGGELKSIYFSMLSAVLISDGTETHPLRNQSEEKYIGILRKLFDEFRVSR